MGNETFETEKIERLILDVSEYQGMIDWDLLATDKRVRGVILRATFGNTGVDKQFSRNYRESKRVGLLFGAYHFADPDRRDRDAGSEATHFIVTVWMAEVAALKAAGKPQPSLPTFVQSKHMCFALDIEKAKSISKGEEFCEWVITFCEVADDLLQCKYTCGIYTGGPFWNEHDGEPSDEVLDKLRHRWLWIAAYVNDPTKYIAMTPWKDRGAAMHQITGDVSPGGKPGRRFPGITVNVVDTNVFLAHEDERHWLEAMWLDDEPIRYPDTEIPQAVDVLDRIRDDTEKPEPNS